MTATIKRGGMYHLDSSVGGRRLRCSLGTSDPKIARKMAERVGLAIADGPDSDKWTTLRLVLPKASYRTLATGMSVSVPPDLAEFEKLFKEQLDRREKLGEIAPGTHKAYEAAADSFFTWLAEEGFQKMENITPSLLEKYQVWRREKISENPRSKNGKTLNTDSSVLSAIFALALEEKVIQKSPFKGRFRGYAEAAPVSPFTKEEMGRLDLHAVGEVRLLFLLLRWTGLRGSDAAIVTWDSISDDWKTLTWKTAKRGTTVKIPLAAELVDALKEAYPWEDEAEGRYLGTILEGMTRPKIYSIIRKLGDEAGVEDCRPHRFRHALACTILERGGTIYDVAKILGDHVSTVEKHYAPFTDRLQERVRKILDEVTA